MAILYCKHSLANAQNSGAGGSQVGHVTIGVETAMSIGEGFGLIVRWASGCQGALVSVEGGLRTGHILSACFGLGDEILNRGEPQVKALVNQPDLF